MRGLLGFLCGLAIALWTFPAVAGELPRIPGVYIKLVDGTCKWLPPLGYGTRYDQGPDGAGPPMETAILDIGDVLAAPTVDQSTIDQIVISGQGEWLHYVFSLAFVDDYGGDGADPGALAVTRWGFSDDYFETRHFAPMHKAYRPVGGAAFFSNYTYSAAGPDNRKIIDVGRVIATNRGLYLFNTSGSLSNLLWNIHRNRRSAHIPRMEALLARLERAASRYNEWGTVAWTYKDFGDTATAVRIYRDKVIPHTLAFDEERRDAWARYYEEIQK